MANSKNTIQNIPLTGQLCLNTLKTDVTQFEGYNEKNSTVFGGELVPIRNKETSSYSQYKTKHLYNSKGDDFEIDLANHTLKKNGVTVNSNVGRIIKNINLSEIIPEKNVYWAALARTPHLGEPLEMYYVAELEDVSFSSIQSRLFYLRKDADGTITKTIVGTTVTGQNSKGTSSAYRLFYSGNGTGCFVEAEQDGKERVNGQIMVFINNQGNHYVSIIGVENLTETLYPPIVSIRKTTNGCSVYLNSAVGYFTDTNDFTTYKWDVDLSNGNIGEKEALSTCTYSIGGFPEKGDWKEFSVGHSSSTMTNRKVFELGPWSASLYNSYYDVTNDGYIFVSGYNKECSFLTSNNEGITGYSELFNGQNPFLKKIVGDYYDGYGLYTLETNLLSISLFGLPVCTPTSIESNNITFAYDSPIANEPVDGVSYLANKTWYFSGFPYVRSGELPYLENSDYNSIILDNRYVLCIKNASSFDSGICLAYDIEESKEIDISSVGYIFTGFPVAAGTRASKTGAIFAGGYNSAFEISKNPFTGYLPNPTIITGFPNSFERWSRMISTQSASIPDDVDTYLSIGDSVMSAEYNGINPEYVGTKYSIDANGNVILPITASSKIIKGYSNNDLIDTGSSVYPLIYYNNTGKLYSYYLLSSIDNLKCTFALQSQQYGVTDKNILTVSISNGIVSNVNSVAYVKGLMFLGTLPTSAVFYSKLNKVFYRFTGDAILSKMFEASDINEIKFVGQNPSSLSLWICTDTGVYIMSDTDMFKLDYKADSVSFCDSFVIIDENDFDTEQNEYKHTTNRISLYDIGDGATETPIKLHTKYYGLGGELKATYDCWYIRLHNNDHKAGKLKLKVNTITNTSFETEEKTYDIEPSMYDGNDTIFIRYQPKYQSAVATQLELESDIAIYQISLGVNTTDAVAQQSKFNF